MTVVNSQHRAGVGCLWIRPWKSYLPIIGVGGISNAEDAWEKITNGACLVQIYSSMVFNGASVVKEIVNGLDRKLKSKGLTNLEQAIGLARGD